MFSKKWLVLGCLSISPIHAFASECDRITNTIHNFTQLPATERATAHPSWMNFTWLKRNLGKPQEERSNNRVIYKWRCSEDGSSYLNLVTDMQGNVISVSGVYNSDEGSGMFYGSLRKPNSDSPGAAQTQVKPQAPSQNQPQAAPQAAPQMSALPHPTPHLPTQLPETPIAARSTIPITQAPNVSTKPGRKMSCLQILNQINADNAKYHFEINKQALPWMKLEWLMSQLGKPVLSPVNATFYQWDNYSLYDSGTGSMQTSGTLPKPIDQNKGVPSNSEKLAEAFKQLGQPKQKVLDNLTEYKWTCNPKASFSAIGDKENTLIQVIGTCKNSSCNSVYINLTGDMAYHAFEQQMQQNAEHAQQVSPHPGDVTTAVPVSETIPAPALPYQPEKMEQAVVPIKPSPIVPPTAPHVQEEASESSNSQIKSLDSKALTAAFNTYNAEYKTTISDASQLETAITNQMQNFYNYLHICRSGTYNFAKFLVGTLVIAKADVTGMMGGKCLVDIKYVLAGTNVNVKCGFPSETLLLFTPEQAKKDASEVSRNSFSSDLQKVTKDQCVSTTN